jgi:nucleoid-associated protein YgaU
MNSPDTAKFRTVHQGDSLWAMSAKEYGECSSWRLIAAANGIENPRLLDSGSTLSLPAIES